MGAIKNRARAAKAATREAKKPVFEQTQSLSAVSQIIDSFRRVFEGVAIWLIGSGLVLVILQENKTYFFGGIQLVIVGVCAIIYANSLSLIRRKPK
jgi:hypothetical protein